MPTTDELATWLGQLQSMDDDVREAANSALEDCGAPQAEQLPVLVEHLTHANADVAYWAATLLGRMQAAASAAVKSLAAVLISTAAINVRQRAAWALGQIGSAAKSSEPALQAAAQAADPRLARLAKAALEQIREAS